MERSDFWSGGKNRGAARGRAPGGGSGELHGAAAWPGRRAGREKMEMEQSVVSEGNRGVRVMSDNCGGGFQKMPLRQVFGTGGSIKLAM